MSSARALSQLHELRALGGRASTLGLDDVAIARFLVQSPELGRAISEAHTAHAQLRAQHPEVIGLDEASLVAWTQEDWVNFYSADAVQPYVALAARGPWIVTAHGAVLYDCGGYGMLGFGHSPEAILPAVARPVPNANIMTPSLSLKRFAEALRRELGHTRPDGCPFARFIAMNSGSEAVSVAARIADVHARRATDPGGRHAGKKVRYLAIEGGFHGRTDRPAQASDSSLPAYRKHLRTFRDQTFLVTTPPNDVEALRATFARAEAEGIFFELMLVEPVMGEGRPGVGITRAFYDEARRLTREMGSLLLVDSIQAGLRGHGVLSLVDYPGFQDADAPDFETWSKALNAAQYPLSVLGLGTFAASLYVPGIYGNTMTAHPRGLEIGTEVLAHFTPELRAQIVRAGSTFRAGLEALQRDHADVVREVTGTGLLLALWLDERVPVLGFEGLETWCRHHGVNVIHGGTNALRFTPHFGITDAEITLVLDVLRAGIARFSALAAA